MSDDKMSDFFDLPRKAHWSEDGYVFLRLQGKQAELAVIAINAYDANQERIAELESLLQKFIPCDEDGNGQFLYSEGSEYLGELVNKTLEQSK